tara:strand:- start:73509 stop:74183 length:675 start_codon:yes stop_codon:yes gene_type:complete
MALILCLETTTTNCSVAIAKDGEVVVLREDMGLNYSHAERLHTYIAEVLESSDFGFNDLDAIAVSKGPGSYTGLRIGVSCAKGLCYALEIPLLAIDTLKSIAMQVASPIDYIIPMLDARRMEVYSAVFSNDFEKIRDTEAQILDNHSFEFYLENGKTAFIGNGVLKFKELREHENALYLTEALPSAREMAILGYNKYKIGDFEDVAYFEPYYLKDFLVTKPKKV